MNSRNKKYTREAVRQLIRKNPERAERLLAELRVLAQLRLMKAAAKNN